MAETSIQARTEIQFLYIEGGPGQIKSDSEVLRKFCERLNITLKRECPVNKNPHARNRGALRESLSVRPLPVGEDTAIGFYALDYVEWVLGGTKPHVIEPREGSAASGRITKSGRTPNRRALVFQWQTHLKTPTRRTRGRISSRGHAWAQPRFVGEAGEGHVVGYFSQLHAALRLSRGRPAYGGVRIGSSRVKLASGDFAMRPRLAARAGRIHPYSPANVEESDIYGGEGAVALARVNHPGAKPNNFLARALANSSGAIEEFENELGDSLESLAVRTITSQFKAFGGTF